MNLSVFFLNVGQDCVYRRNWCTIGRMSLKSFITISGCILVVIGTVGLLLNEFAWESTTTRTIIFAVVNFVGLVDIAFAHFALKENRG